jgi:hypothetical protein
MPDPDSSPALPETPIDRKPVACGETLASPGTPRPRSLIIVAREELGLWLYLTRTYGRIPALQVFLDRRQKERRHQVQPYTPERRQADRRRPLSSERILRRQPFLVVPH